MQPLSAQQLFGTAGGRRIIGLEGEVLGIVESTMDAARRQAAAGVPDGFVVLAERQRSGRGRKGIWECPAGEGLLMTVVLRLGVRASERPQLALLGAVAATEAAAHYVPRVGIKWPNDIVVAGEGEPMALRKLGGVLVEQARCGDSAPAHLLGIGLNVDQDRRRLPLGTGLPATSMKLEGGRPIDRAALCAKLMDQLDGWYDRVRRGRPEALLARWRRLSCLMGHRVCARTGGQCIEGTVVALRAGGELILRAAGGEEVILTSERSTLLFPRPAP